MPDGSDLYIIQSDVTGAVKIGRSKDARARLRQLQTGSPYRLKLLASFPGKGMIERHLHTSLLRYRLKQDGEWFHYDCFNEMPMWIYERLPFEDRWWVREEIELNLCK